MAIREIKVLCWECYGCGTTESHHTDGPSTVHGCSNCGGKGEQGSPFKDNAFQRGSGKATVKFAETGARCTHCEGRGGHPGVYETTEEGWDRNGQRYRKVTKGYKNPSCSHCLGTGKELRELQRTMCPECEWKGKKKVWQKEKVLFMSTGREIEVETNCAKCDGKGWIYQAADRIFTGNSDYRLP